MKNNAPKPTKRFYVYNLADPHDKIFYVGKGCGGRVHQHEQEARRRCECHKCRKIRKIWQRGGEVRKYIVFETENEDEAYGYEEELITSIGLKNLCNKTVGGRRNCSISNEELAARLEAIDDYKIRLQEEKEREHALRLWWFKEFQRRTKRGRPQARNKG